MEKKNEWIASEKKNFGKAGTAYDFKDYNYEIGDTQIKEKEKRKETLGTTINAKAMSLLGNAEEKVNQVMFLTKTFSALNWKRKDRNLRKISNNCLMQSKNWIVKRNEKLSKRIAVLMMISITFSHRYSRELMLDLFHRKAHLF